MDKPLTQRLRADRQTVFRDEYERAGGYQALRRAVGAMSPDDVLDTVKKSGLRGRGGAGFPTGMKWSFVPRGDAARHPTYLVANADEMEPGTFKDRLLLEGDPHQVIEGLLIAAFTIQADVAYIFLRDEYRHAARCLRRAIAEAKDAGYVGRNILGSGWSLDLHLHTSAGRYICGEETAQINSLQGRRATPRTKPPFPQVSGLFGCPTIVQNVETLCNIPHIITGGIDWYKGLSRTENAGTKLYGVSGKVNRPGVWEMPMGVTAGEILSGPAGGMREGLALRGFLPGGGSTDFLTADHLDVPLDYDQVAKVGSRMGTGTMILLDDRTCPVGMVANLERFFAQESCGWCTPCRDGLSWVHRLTDDLEHGRGEPGDLELLEHHCAMLAPGHTFCAHAPGAVEPLQSALKYFREDFEQHIRERRCPYRSAP